MDILTQGLLGGVLAQSVATKDETKLATLVGVIAGLLADADVLIYSASDPLLNIEFHRHFTHSLFFIPFGAAIALMILWPFLHRHIPVGRLYLFCLLGYSMSGVLDACTSYGTHLFWPFSDERVAWSIISIIDPVFTLILLVTLIRVLRTKHKQVAYWGLGVCGLYFLFGFAQLQRAQNMAEELLVTRGHSTTQHIVKPTMANLLLWRSVYIHNNRIYVDAMRVGLFSENKVFEGESVEKFSVEKYLPGLDVSSVLHADIQRFSKFSDGFVALEYKEESSQGMKNISAEKNVLGDLRYSMLPVSAKPLWGIIIDKKNPQLHADYLFFRDNSQKVRQTFLDMLLLND